MTSLILTLAQMDIALGDPQQNFARAEALLAEAAARTADAAPHLVLLPELWSTAYDLARAPQLAHPLAEDGVDAFAPGNAFARIALLAQQHRLWIAGSILEANAGRQYNCLTVFSPAGRLAGVYRKVHLFRLMQEE
ncbi:MAG: nitrilase-related carbon-nitrogen hydrolase, partial [Caldilineaceae bacterium]